MVRAEGPPESNGETGVRKIIILLYYFGGDDQSESRYDGHVLTVQKISSDNQRYINGKSDTGGKSLRHC